MPRRITSYDMEVVFMLDGNEITKEEAIQHVIKLSQKNGGTNVQVSPDKNS
jgi:hypothetical protein